MTDVQISSSLSIRVIEESTFYDENLSVIPADAVDFT